MRADGHFVPPEDSSLLIHHDGIRDHDDEVHLVIDIFADDREKEHDIYDKESDDDIAEIIAAQSPIEEDKPESGKQEQEEDREKDLIDLI